MHITLLTGQSKNSGSAKKAPESLQGLFHSLQPI
jgi:hypothetical protein